MNRVVPRKDKGFGGALAISVALHLTLFFVLTHLDYLTIFAPKVEPVYYVDILDLPTATPGGGGAPKPVEQPAAQKEPEGVAPQTIPTKLKQQASPQPVEKKSYSAKDLDDRIKNLSQELEDRRQEERIKSIRDKLASTGKGPAQKGGVGTNPTGGSDYGAYIQSRLRDAFSRTIAYQSKSPEVIMRLTLDRNGRILRQRIERSTGDKMFEDAVKKAVVLAEPTFTANPRGEQFENGFIFRPEGVGRH